jgi:glycosyltransferase involved in cell wall biosynthesis
MRILVDYRAALRARTGVGEYMHTLVRAYTAAFSDEVLLFSSSWKDRPEPGVVREIRATVVDRRIPVRVLNLLWHRAEWPPIESLVGPVDVAHAAHPLLIPARAAAQVVTIHDLFFLQHPERTRAEIRRDYARLAADHARRADAVITSTHRTRALVHQQLGVPAEAIYVCPPGPPRWESLGRGPHLPHDGCILFLGTLEPRKNVGVLLEAYTVLLGRQPSAPRLVLAGRATPDAAPWLDRLARAPLQGRAFHIGYVPDAQQEALFASARVLVLPSVDEGFGLPVLAAMSAGIPVIASNRGSLPEVVGRAGVLFDPDDADALAQALERVTTDAGFAVERATAGLQQAGTFSWEKAAATLHEAYRDAVGRRRARRETGLV